MKKILILICSITSILFVSGQCSEDFSLTAGPVLSNQSIGAELGLSGMESNFNFHLNAEMFKGYIQTKEGEEVIPEGRLFLTAGYRIIQLDYTLSIIPTIGFGVDSKTEMYKSFSVKFLIPANNKAFIIEPRYNNQFGIKGSIIWNNIF